MKHSILLIFLSLCSLNSFSQKHRVLVSTDAGGSDPDDFQSLVHLFLYADTLDIVGLVSSPPHNGRKNDLLKVIDCYQKDYPKLKGIYPTPDYLRSITAQGAIEVQKEDLPTDKTNEGVQLIIKEALKIDARPLYVLIWGSMTDLAIALQRVPEIKNNIRVYSIGSWNTLQDSLARNYIFNNHQDLWWIENNTTFRGMYVGGYQDADYGNKSFVEIKVRPYGTLGEFFFSQKADLKMGDTPSVLYLLNGDPTNPESESWGGQFQKSKNHLNYWTDKKDWEYIENGRAGAKTVNKWRKQFLDDWARKMSFLK